jgi:hypothetical protein
VLYGAARLRRGGAHGCMPIFSPDMSDISASTRNRAHRRMARKRSRADEADVLLTIQAGALASPLPDLRRVTVLVLQGDLVPHLSLADERLLERSRMRPATVRLVNCNAVSLLSSDFLRTSAIMDRVTCVGVHNSLASNLHWVRHRASQFKRFLVDARSARTGFVTWSLFNLSWPLTNLEEMVVLGPLRATDIEAFLQRNFHCRALRRLEFPEMFAYTPPLSSTTTKVQRKTPAAKSRSHEQKWAVYLDAKAAESPAFVRLLGPTVQPVWLAPRVAAVAQWLPVADVPELVLDFAM